MKIGSATFATIHALTTSFLARRIVAEQECRDALFSDYQGGKQKLMLPNCELFPSDRVWCAMLASLVRFEHSQNRQNAKSRFEVSRLRQVQNLPQKSYRKSRRRLALR